MSCSNNSTRPKDRMSRALRAFRQAIARETAVVMGKRSTFSRIPQDAYPTPAEAVAPLRPHLAPITRFIEPCCGDGHLIEHLVSAGHMCVGRCDLPDDARTWRYPEREPGIVFITNPPWRRDVLHLIIVNLSDQAPTWLLIDAGWVHTQAVRALPAPPPHHRQRRPSEVDQGFAVHRQGRLRLASL